MPAPSSPARLPFRRRDRSLLRSVSAFALLGAAGLLCRGATGDEFNMKVTAADIRLGGHVSGPMLSADAIANRVLLLEFWGVNCPPCIRSMPLLEEFHKSLGPQGLVVIGAHAQGGTAEELRPELAKLGTTFTILENATVEGGSDFQGIPHCMLFDHTGACLYRGSPFNVEEAVVAAVKAAPGAILEGRTLVKLTDFNTLLRDERQFSPALKKAHGLAASKDADTAAEAAFVVEKLGAYGRRLLDEATSSKEHDAARAADLVQRCAAVFKGSDVGTEAAKLAAEWKKDKAFLAAVKACQQLAQLEQMRSFVIEQLGAEPDGELAPEKAATIPAAMKGRMRTLAQGITRTCPGSPQADKAAAIVAQLAL
jgi:thiol-disulfide isomerase/thioredoxin